MFKLWLTLALGTFVSFMAKRLLQNILSKLVPANEFAGFNPIWKYWDLIVIITSFCFVLICSISIKLS